jgi:hypothetical protein
MSGDPKSKPPGPDEKLGLTGATVAVALGDSSAGEVLGAVPQPPRAMLATTAAARSEVPRREGDRCTTEE